MGRWLTMRNANRAAWGVLGLLAAVIALFAISLLVLRVTSGRSREDGARTVEARTPQPQATTGPTIRTSGTLEQVQGQAFVLREPGGEAQRVLLRAGAPIARVTVAAGAGQLREGDPVFISRLVEQQDNTLAVMEVTVMPLPENVPAEQCGRYGTVSAVAGNRLSYESRCGPRVLPMRRSVTVRRVEAVDVSALKPGQQAEVVAQRLPDGTLSAFQVQVTEMQ